MSAGGGWRAVPVPASAVVDRTSRLLGRRPARAVALAGVCGVLGAFLSVLYTALVVTGDPTTLSPIVAGALVTGTIAARLVRPRTAAFLSVGGVACGGYLYVLSLPGGVEFLTLLAPMLDDASVLLSGLSILRIVNADLWVLSAAPVPVFFAWYLALRRRYVAASAVAGGALGFVVLTGDATVGETLAGVVGVTVAVAFGDCDRRQERLRNADGAVLVVAAMLVSTLVVGAAPGAVGTLLSPEGVGDAGSTVESSLVHAGDSIAVTGSIDLSPERRYTVEADERAYWRVGTYDRFTGDGWVRSGSTREYDGSLPGPPGESRTLRQTYTAESTIATLPAARKPTRIDGVPVPVLVTGGGSFEPASPLQAGESYRVESEVPTASPDRLRRAGTSYPAGIEDRYTQLPTDTPDRVAERTDRLTANAENPYDTARTLEHWLRTEYEYSLDVDRPRGNVADAFLFEMEAGYCTYFATTMVAMLRTQGIPARFAVGYTPGEQVDDREWTVRGYNSHAWVEVYLPEHGWIKFDPTPAEPREAAERATLDDSIETDDTSEDGAGGADTPGPDTSEPSAGTTETPAAGAGAEDVGIDPVAAADQRADDGASGVPSVPAPVQLAGGVALLAAAVVARRRGVGRRLYRELWLRRPPGGDPEAVVAGVYRRAVYLEERRGRTKAADETPRQFFAGSDERFERIRERYERARYGDGVDAATAERARSDLAGLLAERSLLPWRAEKPDRGSR